MPEAPGARPAPPARGTSAAHDDDDDHVVDNKQAATEQIKVSRIEVRSQEPAAPTGPQPRDAGCCACCTGRCCCKALLPLWWFVLFLLYLIGLVLTLVFVILHGVLRWIHGLFFVLAMMRIFMDENLDVEMLIAKHADDVRADQVVFNAEQDKKKRERAAYKARFEQEKQQGKRHRDDKITSSDSDEVFSEPPVRLCSFGCSGSSAFFFLGGIFSMIATLFMSISLVSGVAAAGLWTSMFPSHSLKAAKYLAEFRRGFDVEYANRKKTEPS